MQMSEEFCRCRFPCVLRPGMFGFVGQFPHEVRVYRYLFEAIHYRRFTLRDDTFPPLFRVVKTLSMNILDRLLPIEGLANRFCIHLSHQTTDVLPLTTQGAALMHVLRIANRVQQIIRQTQGVEFDRFEFDESLTERLQLMAVPFSLRLAYAAAFGNFVSFTHDTWRRLTAAIRGSPRKGFPALKKASRK